VGYERDRLVRCREKINAQQRARHEVRGRTDPEYLEKKRASGRAAAQKRLDENRLDREKLRAQQKARHTVRYATDPEYREKRRASARKSAAKRRGKARKERLQKL